MLITFRSDAYENIVMFGDIAQHLLTIMGVSHSLPGAMTAEELPAALNRLQQNIAGEKNGSTFLKQTRANDEENEPSVSLAHRALPLIKMLNAAIQHQCHVRWDKN